MEQKWTDSDLRIAYEDACKYSSFADLKQYLKAKKISSQISWKALRDLGIYYKEECGDIQALCIEAVLQYNVPTMKLVDALLLVGKYAPKAAHIEGYIQVITDMLINGVDPIQSIKTLINKDE